MVLIDLRFGFVTGLLHGQHLESLDGAGDETDLILANKAGQHDVEIAFG